MVMAEEGAHARNHWLLKGISNEDADLLVQSGREVFFEPGEVVFHEGDAADGLYLITRGKVLLTAIGANGEMMLATVHADQVLGELGVLDAKPRSAQAKAQSICAAHFIPAEPFLDVLERSNPLCMRVMALLTQRLRYANGRLGELAPEAGSESPQHVA
jgi:CRP/FNR family cyclic AMP-dependent transcriptional regulator